MRYTEHQHRHNFAVWAGARAAQRGFTGVGLLREALEQSGVESFARQPKKLKEFDEQHSCWCNSISRFLDNKGVVGASYGRAAKLVNIYLKSMVVLRDLSGKSADVIHPPIDSILLSNLARDPKVDISARKKLRAVRWTKMDQEEYFRVIDLLRSINGERPFWEIEKYWTVSKEVVREC